MSHCKVKEVKHKYIHCTHTVQSISYNWNVYSGSWLTGICWLLRVFLSRKMTATVEFLSSRWDIILSHLSILPVPSFIHHIVFLSVSVSTADVSRWSSLCSSVRRTCLASARDSTRSCVTVASTIELLNNSHLYSLTAYLVTWDGLYKPVLLTACFTS